MTTIIPGKNVHIPEITEIFNHYILHSNSRFETEPFTEENRTTWFEQFSEELPHQIYCAIENNKVVGFACTQPYRPSTAFSDTVEITIYLSPDVMTKGIGSALYSRLLSHVKSHNVHKVLSGIAVPNVASIALHKKFGFKEIGIFNEYAKKNNQYVSSMWMELSIS
ncbi:GNAT family N-acetyltransferase [Veronia pacifica]|uniref:GCN5 family acetyltransferase n=1 Tax=Veronia pacifica TaxID=1080227 RepID=A0A1C3EMP6_9GAMM|nr:GNAT family N-acetyltransferase [Veronia pacifica]ODA34501.1 GCN5 family acetyltransferase [Veronia pacifica]